MEESYLNLKIILEALQYDVHQWIIRGDLKIVGLMLGMQTGYTKHMCYLCLWDSRVDSLHYPKQEWGKRSWKVDPNAKKPIENVKYPPLVNPVNVLIPPLHVKLGLMKNFVEELEKKW